MDHFRSTQKWLCMDRSRPKNRFSTSFFRKFSRFALRSRQLRYYIQYKCNRKTNLRAFSPAEIFFKSSQDATLPNTLFFKSPFKKPCQELKILPPNPQPRLNGFRFSKTAVFAPFPSPRLNENRSPSQGAPRFFKSPFKNPCQEHKFFAPIPYPRLHDFRFQKSRFLLHSLLPDLIKIKTSLLKSKRHLLEPTTQNSGKGVQSLPTETQRLITLACLDKNCRKTLPGHRQKYAKIGHFNIVERQA